MTIAYGSTVVVSGLDLEVGRGEMLALLGPSGCGKTTILSALAGFLPIRSGEIRIGGRTVAGDGRHLPPERRDVGVVFQGYALWPHLDALDTVAYPIRRRGVGAARGAPPGDRDPRAARDRPAGRTAGRRSCRAASSSGSAWGARSRARRASTCSTSRPPTSTPTLRDRLQLEIADQRRRSGAAAIYATHDTAEALAIADRVALLREGRLVQEGTPTTVYERPVDLWAARLTGLASIVELAIGDVGENGGSTRTEIAGVAQVPIVAAADSAATAAGRIVGAIVRPDWVRLGGAVPGRVETVAFRGAHTDYRLATAAGTIDLRAGGPPTVAEGDAVGWSLDRAWIPAAPIEGRDRQSARRRVTRGTGRGRKPRSMLPISGPRSWRGSLPRAGGPVR